MRLTYWHASNPKNVCFFGVYIVRICAFPSRWNQQLWTVMYTMLVFPDSISAWSEIFKRKTIQEHVPGDKSEIRQSKWLGKWCFFFLSFLKSNSLRAFEMKNWNKRHSNLLKLLLSQTINEQSKYSNSCRPFPFYSILSRFIHSVREKSSLLYKYISFGLIS